MATVISREGVYHASNPVITYYNTLLVDYCIIYTMKPILQEPQNNQALIKIVGVHQNFTLKQTCIERTYRIQQLNHGNFANRKSRVFGGFTRDFSHFRNCTVLKSFPLQLIKNFTKPGVFRRLALYNP